MKRALSNLRLNLLGPKHHGKADNSDGDVSGDRSDDDDHLTGGQTTPHPSGLDKRLPQILHGFQQVCGALVPPSLARKASCPPPPSPLHRTTVEGESGGDEEDGGSGSGGAGTTATTTTTTTAGVASASTAAAATPPEEEEIDSPSSSATPSAVTSASASTAASSAATSFSVPDRHVFSSLSSGEREKDSLRLTASALLEGKDTPPATPRGTTSAGSALNSAAATTTTTTPTSNPTPPPPPSRQPTGTLTPTSGSTSSGATNSSSGGQHNTPTVGPPKGKMVVRIQEARGLRSSKDPYVVCTFESNEFISKGPKKDETGAGEPQDKNGASAGIAIPMKSRQSSSTSLSELQGTISKKGTTNPKWEHEAVL